MVDSAKKKCRSESQLRREREEKGDETIAVDVLLTVSKAFRSCESLVFSFGLDLASIFSLLRPATSVMKNPIKDRKVSSERTSLSSLSLPLYLFFSFLFFLYSSLTS